MALISITTEQLALYMGSMVASYIGVDNERDIRLWCAQREEQFINAAECLIKNHEVGPDVKDYYH